MDLDEPNKLFNSDLTDGNISNYPSTIAKGPIEDGQSCFRVELTTKRAVELLLEGKLRSKVCRYCLNVASPLSDLDQIMQIGGKGVLYKVTIRDMVASFYPFKALKEPNFPNRICNKCLDRTISAYLFTQQCEQSERALKNCFEDMYTKLEKLDPLDRTKKRGRQKINPNYNILYTDHPMVVDYAEPMRQIVNLQSVMLSKENYISDLECPKCWQVFTKIDDLIVHEKTHPSTMWFNCRLCGKSFPKRLQLKRHWKQDHRGPDSSTLDVPEKTDFQCCSCDFVSKDHYVHLQHIEKHKFQSVLEHLVEKNMDKLCAVCLDKAPQLTKLDKMVRLHGGYPGATGDKTLYSILGSTLPDPKSQSYKYQELHVPHHAKIMKFVKLTKDKPQDCPPDDAKCETNQIIISNPLIISNDRFDCDEMFLFFFSDPSYYKIDEINKKEMYALIEKNNTEAIAKSNEEKEPSNFKEHMNAKLPFLEVGIEKIEKKNSMENANEGLNILDIGNKTIELNPSEAVTNLTDFDATSVNETPCKTCWIFNKPTCSKCVNSQNNLKEMNTDTDNTNIKPTGKCQYCWLFKNSDKCDVCKNPINTKGDINLKTKHTDEIIVAQDTNQVVERKRKLSCETKIKRKWDCNICLTTNMGDRQTCICCESNKDNQNDSLKVILDCKHPFKVLKTDDFRHELKNTCPNYNTADDIPNLHEHTLTPIVSRKYVEGTHHPNEDASTNVFESSNNDQVTQVKNLDTEAMDIEDEDDHQIMLPRNPNPFSFNIGHSSNVAIQLSNIEHSNILLPNQSVKFNIGTGSFKETGTHGRRIVRPLRRMAYHK